MTNGRLTDGARGPDIVRGPALGRASGSLAELFRALRPPAFRAPEGAVVGGCMRRPPRGHIERSDEMLIQRSRTATRTRPDRAVRGRGRGRRDMTGDSPESGLLGPEPTNRPTASSRAR